MRVWETGGLGTGWGGQIFRGEQALSPRGQLCRQCFAHQRTPGLNRPSVGLDGDRALGLRQAEEGPGPCGRGAA